MKFRQSLMKYSEKYGVKRASRKYNKCRSYIYFWKSRWDGTVESLAEQSKRPHHHSNEHTPDELKLIRDRRRRNPKLGLTELRLYPPGHGWNNFNYWGLHLFLGKFGGGKTISAVRRCYNICKTHKGVTVLTNLTLTCFPEDTKIIKLVNSAQILELPDNP